MADRLSTLVARTLGVPVEQISDASGPGTDGGWTSLKHLQIVAAVEDAFGVVFTAREIRQITTLGHLRGLLRLRETVS